jgi:hypothetical protein
MDNFCDFAEESIYNSTRFVNHLKTREKMYVQYKDLQKKSCKDKKKKLSKIKKLRKREESNFFQSQLIEGGVDSCPK